MESIETTTVHYCSVSRANRIQYVYTRGDPEIDKVAALCLDKVPPFHTTYFETVRNKTYAFLIKDKYVFFTILDAGLGNSDVLGFLHHLSDQFKTTMSKRGSFSGLLPTSVQEQLVPVIRRLITSLEQIAHTTANDHSSQPSPTEQMTSTKAPLLGKSSNKQDKKKSKELSNIDLEENRKGADRGLKTEDSSTHQTRSMSLHKDSGTRRVRSGSQIIDKKWRRQVQIVLAIDFAICLILFAVWLAICRGIECTRS